MRFDSKICAIEEILDMDTMTVDELHGTLTTYEMRIEQEDPLGKEATFKASNQKGTSKPRRKLEYSNNDESNSEEEANLVRKLKRGTCKYKGKLPLKCFECCRIGHFSSKCPNAKNPNSDDENNCKKNKSFQNYKKGKKMEGLPKAKIFIQRRTTTHLMMTHIVIMTLKRWFSWPWIQKKLLMIMMGLKRKEK